MEETGLREVIVEEAVALRELEFSQVEFPSSMDPDDISHREEPASTSM